FTLTIGNASGQENAAAEGDLDLTGAGRKYIFTGAGADQTIIDQQTLDRVFHLLDGVDVEFRNLTIRGGEARDDGSPGFVPGDSGAYGGGILAFNAQLLLDGIVVENNDAIATGACECGDGDEGRGGGLFIQSTVDGTPAKLTITNGSILRDNTAAGARGEDLSSSSSNSGTPFAGEGGDAYGGAVYAENTDLVINAGTQLVENFAFGGEGGSFVDPGSSGYGGDGGDAFGGGLFTQRSGVAVDGATFSGNVAIGGVGGRNFSGGQGSSESGDGGFAYGGGGAILSFGDPIGASILNALFSNNMAVGGAGGPATPAVSSSSSRGGNGGDGVGGGLNFTGDFTTIAVGASQFTANLAKGGEGADAGLVPTVDTMENPLSGTDGGDGGDGGFAVGGAIAVEAEAESFTVAGSTFTGNAAAAGFGGDGADVSAFLGGSFSGGDGGDGGFAFGGAVDVLGDVAATIATSTFNLNLATGGNGGAGGAGGGTTDIQSYGGSGGFGGDGGFALGGGVAFEGFGLSLSQSTLAGNRAVGGAGGAGALGGPENFGPRDVTTAAVGFDGAGGSGGFAFGGGLVVGSEIFDELAEFDDFGGSP
ncbi:MAG: hypothetical protein ACRDD1_00965, partial [Planctomycetia bacterium]